MNCINLIHFHLTAGQLRRSSCIDIPGVVCELLQFAAVQQAGIVNFFVNHTHTQFTEESKVATTLTPQTDITFGKSHVTDGEPETVVLASLQRIKSIKNQIKIIIFNFIKSETSDSFVSHFDGRFAYLKTLDFKACKIFTFHSGKKVRPDGFNTLTCNNLKTTTDTAMQLCMYIKLSVKYPCSSICTYFESVGVLKSAKSSLFTEEKGCVY